MRKVTEVQPPPKGISGAYAVWLCSTVWVRAAVSFFFFFLQTNIYFRLLLDLQKSYKDSIKFLSTPHPVPLLLTAYITVCTYHNYETDIGALLFTKLQTLFACRYCFFPALGSDPGHRIHLFVLSLLFSPAYDCLSVFPCFS